MLSAKGLRKGLAWHTILRLNRGTTTTINVCLGRGVFAAMIFPQFPDDPHQTLDVLSREREIHGAHLAGVLPCKQQHTFNLRTALRTIRGIAFEKSKIYCPHIKVLILPPPLLLLPSKLQKYI